MVYNSYKTKPPRQGTTSRITNLTLARNHTIPVMCDVLGVMSDISKIALAIFILKGLQVTTSLLYCIYSYRNVYWTIAQEKKLHPKIYSINK